MPRLLFSKTGNAVWISHLDLMRLFQRGFKRAGLSLTHTQGFNQRPSVSIALPLSVGIESQCELLDFDLDGQDAVADEILSRLNQSLIDGIEVCAVYFDGQKLKNLAYLDCVLYLEYDREVPEGTLAAIRELFARESLILDKKGKNGITQQDIIPMIRRFEVNAADEKCILVKARVCCQNPTLNPMQIANAISVYLPDFAPDYVRCSRIEIFDTNEEIFR